MIPDVVAVTAEYERWLGERIPLVAEDLVAKHEEMAGSVLRFLRGTYYLWLPRVAELLPELVHASVVPLVGDLHVENFGTWRDHRGVRRWGVNDFDELVWGAYTLDLVRLATSAALLPDTGLSTRELCGVLLEAWSEAKPSVAVGVTAGSAQHLSRLVPVNEATGFYKALRATPDVEPSAVPAPVRAAVEHTVEPGWQPRWHARRAGTGSLGHPRLDAIGADRRRQWQVREVKLLGPATAAWCEEQGAAVAVVDDLLYGRVIAAVRGPDPSRRVRGWQIRRLAPDVVRVQLPGLRRRDVRRVMRSMAAAMASVHGVDRASLRAARADAARRGTRWLVDAVDVMVADTRDCYRAWRQGMPSVSS